MPPTTAIIICKHGSWKYPYIFIPSSWHGFIIVLQTHLDSSGQLRRQGFFSKFLMGGGDSKFFVPDRDEVDGGGGTWEENLTEAKTAHLMQN